MVLSYIYVLYVLRLCDEYLELRVGRGKAREKYPRCLSPELHVWQSLEMQELMRSLVESSMMYGVEIWGCAQ